MGGGGASLAALFFGGTGTSEHESVKPITCLDGTVVMPYSAPPRKENVRRLKEEQFDVLVVGGGSVGAGVAWDAAQRGLKVALVERDDFGSGTSGRSTKLIHGGVRYLEAAFKKLDYGSFKLVKEALAERAFMLQSAPYMARPLPIMIPMYQWWKVPYFWAGVKVYDLVAGRDSGVPSSRFITRDAALYEFPSLRKEGLVGAIVYYDGQMNDARMNLAVALTAAQAGAVVTPRIEVTSLTKAAAADGEAARVNGATVRDVSTGEEFAVRAHCVVNATGPFSDAVRRMDDAGARDMIVPAAGVHVVLGDHFSPDRMGLIVPETADGRVLFFLPWENGTISGTTDSPSEITMLPRPSEREVDFIIEEANKYLEAKVRARRPRGPPSPVRACPRRTGRR